MQRSDRHDTENSTDLRTLTLTLTVSLFIAMLAFFIVLNAYASESERKLSEIRNSITDAFGLIGEGQSRVETNNDGIGTAGDMEVAASASLRSVLPDVGFQSHGKGTGHTMNVVIPSAEMADRWDELRSRLADLMMNLNPGGRYKLQILSLKDAASGPDLASYAATLEQDGVNPKLLSVGFEARGRDVVELRFVQANR